MKNEKQLLKSLDWAKGNGLIPAVIQDHRTLRVLMVGWMDRQALSKTLNTGLVTFFSRSKKRLWTKGETSGHVLRLVSIRHDCDFDTLLVEAKPSGPVCHTGADSCFDRSRTHKNERTDDLGFLEILEQIVAERFRKRPRGSYISSLITDGLDRMAQKVGEEAVETVIAAKNKSLPLFESEAADLLFHLMILLKARGSSLGKVAQTLGSRLPQQKRRPK